MRSSKREDVQQNLSDKRAREGKRAPVPGGGVPSEPDPPS